MPLSTSHKKVVIERLLKKYLLDGVIPTSDMIESDLEEYQKKYIDLGLPTSSYEDVTIDHGDYSSVEEFKSTISSFATDIDILNQEVYSLASSSSKLHERWITELERIYNKAKKTNNDLNNLLLLTQDTAGGYYSVVGDVFGDMTLVDTENTTAKVDVLESGVFLNSGNQYTEFASLLDTSDMVESDVSFNIITKNNDTFYSLPDGSSNLVNIFKNNESKWVGRVFSSVSGDMVVEVKAKISNEIEEVSKVTALYTGKISDKSSVTLQYSTNGYTWDIPAYSATKPLNKHLSWHFDSKDIKYIKFIFYKPTHDRGKYEYDFSMSNVKVFGNTFSEKLGNEFVSMPLSDDKPDGNPVLFSKVTLETCEETPGNTSIRYYLSGSVDGQSYTDWLPIQPISHSSIKYPKVINLGVSSYQNNTDSSISTLNSSKETSKLTRAFDNSDVDQYKFSGANFAAINTALETSSSDALETIQESCLVWRNIRDKTTYPDTLTVRNIPRGWRKDGKTYSCYFKLTSTKQFDFGSTQCSIDGVPVTGTVKISAGNHKFQTNEEHWFDITENISNLTTNITTEEDLKGVDPLYPHNHKLMIEGFVYSSNYKGAKKYLGTDLSAEYLCKLTSLFDLENNKTGLGHFALRGIGDETHNILGAFVKFDPSYSDYTNELFRIEWRSSEVLYKYIKLKAKLFSSSSNLSPVLQSYRIKLGA